MKLTLLEDTATALANIQHKIEKNKQLKSSDFDEISDAASLEPFLNPASTKPQATGTNEVVVKEQYLRKLFGDKFDNTMNVYSILSQSLDTLGLDNSNNLFLYYLQQLVNNGIEPKQDFASLVYSFVKSKKITKQDIDSWLNIKSLYEKNPKDTQYKIETLLFLKKQNGAKEYNLRIKDASGKYRYLTEKDLYDGSNLHTAAEIRDILQQAQLTGEEEKDTKASDETAEKDLTKAQEKLIKNVISATLVKNPKTNVYDISNIVKNLIVETDTEESLLKKVNAYLKKKGAVSDNAVTKSKPTDKTIKKLFNALVAAGYDRDKVDSILSSNMYDSKSTFADAIGKLASLLDRM